MANDLYRVRGIEETTAALGELKAKATPGGRVGRILKLAAGQLLRYVLGIVHVDTGRLKNSMFQTPPEQSGNDLLAYVATNVEYAPYEHGRGGSHAFFARAVREEGPSIADMYAKQMRKDLLQ